MAKSKISVPSIFLISKFLKQDSLLPIYFFFGEDSYSIDNAVKAVETAVQPFLSSDFDKEIISGKDRTIAEIIDLASAFPFGTERKLIILKDFDELKGDKKIFANYVKNPPSFTTLVISKHGAISNLEAEPYSSLRKYSYIFEANELKGEELIAWIIRYSARKQKAISHENASMLLSIVGENRSLIEMQLQKIFAYLGEEKEITHEIIQKQSSALKEYTIFDLQNAIGLRNRTKAVEIANNLLDKGKEALFIIVMLTRYFTALAQIPELEKNGLSDQEAARIVGTHSFFYKDYKRASLFYRNQKLIKVGKALFNADLTIKTSSIDPKTVITMLLAEIL
ncbi:MAG: DNA polymerase III subunit delta [Bacteroidota bacterium]|nr:DNA polymerase III subunit delta [Bacteroidota bacterium]